MSDKGREAELRYRASEKWKVTSQKYSRSEQRRKLVKERNDKIRAAILATLGGKCCKCGISDARVLQVDHVFGGGTRERKQGHDSNPNHILKKIISGSPNYQCLCANCNWIKRQELKEINQHIIPRLRVK